MEKLSEQMLDALVQIRLFVKLKLASCARAEMRPGFFVSAPERAPVLFPVINRKNRLEGTWSGPQK
jgi:hypothetical protein